MYESYWGLRESPFRSQPDERWFYESPGHAEALARLFFLIEESHAGGVLTGAEGTGKTLVLRLLAHYVARSRRQLVMLDIDGLDAAGFAWKLAGELRLAPCSSEGPPQWWRQIEDAMTGGGISQRHAVIVLDHVDSAEPTCVSGIERLAAAGRRPRGHVTILAASRNLASEALRPLRRMASLRVDLPALNQEQTSLYVTETLQRAGCARPVFEPPALSAVFDRTHGVPRQVNQLCELSLLAAMHEERQIIEPQLVLSAAAEMCV